DLAGRHRERRTAEDLDIGRAVGRVVDRLAGHQVVERGPPGVQGVVVIGEQRVHVHLAGVFWAVQRAELVGRYRVIGIYLVGLAVHYLGDLVGALQPVLLDYLVRVPGGLRLRAPHVEVGVADQHRLGVRVVRLPHVRPGARRDVVAG